MNVGECIQERYELTELLGRGGMAEVWCAQDANLGRDVAIKFLAPHLAEDPEFLVRFFSEAQAVARISHQNVVKVLDFGQQDGGPYLVMEAVGGGSLTGHTGEPLEPARAVVLIAGAARGAGAAHELGIVHRDIKPGNILLDDNGNPQLADFGIASSGRSERLTATGAAIGSPYYFSPEQASGGDATPASDVYALGIVLYELLAGVRPFEGDNVTAIAIAHVDEEPTPPSAHVASLPETIDALVLKCLAKDPAERFADGNELANALESLDDAAPVLVPVPTAAESLWWTSRRVLVGAAVAAGLLALTVAGVLASGDKPVSSVAESRLPNVGGLHTKRSPSPSLSASEARVPSDHEGSDGSKATGGTRRDPGTDEPDDSDPTPEPTSEEPTPKPTADGGSPSP